MRLMPLKRTVGLCTAATREVPWGKVCQWKAPSCENKSLFERRELILKMPLEGFLVQYKHLGKCSPGSAHRGWPTRPASSWKSSRMWQHCPCGIDFSRIKNIKDWGIHGVFLVPLFQKAIALICVYALVCVWEVGGGREIRAPARISWKTTVWSCGGST